MLSSFLSKGRLFMSNWLNLGTKFVAIYALFLGGKFGFKDLLCVKILTFCNSALEVRNRWPLQDLGVTPPRIMITDWVVDRLPFPICIVPHKQSLEDHWRINDHWPANKKLRASDTTTAYDWRPVRNKVDTQKCDNIIFKAVDWFDIHSLFQSLVCNSNIDPSTMDDLAGRLPIG